MPTYLLRRSLRPGEGEPGETPPPGDAPPAAGAGAEDGAFEARDDAEAIAFAQAAADRADGALASVELTDASGRRVWGLRRGETLSRRPDGV